MASVTISEVKTRKSEHQTAPRIVMPPDKSMLHRALILGALSESLISIPLIDRVGEDVVTTIDALRALGVRIDHSDVCITVQGVGKHGLLKPHNPIDCRNSGTTARLLMGVLCAQNFESVLIGDESLSKRPMARLAKLLNENAGADITTTDGTLPVRINARTLHDANVTLSVASAQIKSALLLAAYCSATSMTVSEAYTSRDHTENMLRCCGVDVQSNERNIYLPRKTDMNLPDRYEWHIPGDVSSAMFMIVAAAITHSDLVIEGVGVNPTRTAALDLLSDSGVPLFITNVRSSFNERVGDLSISASQAKALLPFTIGEDSIPNLQDEVPVLSVFAMFANGTSRISGAEELRFKESDRLRTLYQNILAFGGEVTELADGLEIHGAQDFNPNGIVINEYHDHRIAMSMSVAALRSSRDTTLPDASVVSVSYPSFFETLRHISQHSGPRIRVQ